MSSKHSFIIGITRLRKDPGSVMSFELSGTITDLKVVSSYVKDDQIIEVSGVAESVHGGILISGEVSTKWEGECRRCLNPTFGIMRIPVRELYERAGPESELSSQDDTYSYSGAIIDLQEMVKDQVLLELPLAPLCKDDCRGLCVNCGADLNLGPCECEDAAIDPRWAGLDILADKDR
ncbi:MAG: DUF177 domain-containing protein [Actinomycetota bacterium]|nr:MAG: DUF177 domain-containing protein [Actinomycetota bacterium]